VADRTEPPGKRSLLAELHRRHVWRASVVYIGAVWAISQGISQLAPTFGLPATITRWFVVAGAIGFPFWIAFAWYYKLTPAGLRRESDVIEHDPDLHRATGRRLDFWIIGVLSVAVVLLLTNQLAWHLGTAPGDITASISEQSIAVLPLVSEGATKEQKYFSDGISEGLITALSQFAGLKVIGRTSSFQFRDSKDSSKQIGQQLGVAHLLEGSVQYSGDKVRINANLIDANDGSVVWSRHYERPSTDLFALQDAITTAVAAALKSKLLHGHTVESQSDRPPGGNVAAYTALLQGKANAASLSTDGLRKAIDFYHQAIAIDPNYAYAYAGLAFAQVSLGSQLIGAAQSEAYGKARAAADKALALAPDLGMAHQAHAAVLSGADGDAMGALAELRRGLELNPHYAGAIANLGAGLAIVGQLDQAVAMERRAIAADPLRLVVYVNLSNNLAALGRLDDAARVAQKAVSLQPGSLMAHAQLANIQLLQGNAAPVLAWAATVQDPTTRLWFQTAGWIVAGDQAHADSALKEFVGKYGNDQLYITAQLYALKQQPDTMFAWLGRAAAQPGSGLVQGLLSDPLLLRYVHDPRFAALCSKLGLPVPGKPAPAAAASAPSSLADAGALPFELVQG
jgi:TolB-like protein/Tfp pilus assembly protein PilF